MSPSASLETKFESLKPSGRSAAAPSCNIILITANSLILELSNNVCTKVSMLYATLGTNARYLIAWSVFSKKLGRLMGIGCFMLLGLSQVHGVKKRLADFTGLVTCSKSSALPYGQFTTAPAIPRDITSMDTPRRLVS